MGATGRERNDCEECEDVFTRRVWFSTQLKRKRRVVCFFSQKDEAQLIGFDIA
jgi:hypothetical protein